jgi:predicted amidophosphoribosyltransferase
MLPLKAAMKQAMGKHSSNCPECRKRVSDEDESCEHCGCDLTEMEDETQDVDGEGSDNIGEIVQYWSRNPR